MSAARIGSAARRRIFANLRERHGDNCHWCGKAMCFETRQEPRSATIEHVIPKSEGGTNKESNLRLAHRRCNEDRSVPTPRRCRSPFYVLVNA